MSDTYIPTTQLRFERRGTPVRDMFTGELRGVKLILQQLFIDVATNGQVWQDVPVVDEVQR